MFLGGMSMSFLSNLIFGLSLGAIYAMIALGYTMVYGIAKMLNFAHGDVIMIGAYAVYFCVSKFNIDPFISIVLGMAICTVFGIVIEKVAYKPLRNATSLTVLITAIGVSYLLENLALVFFGSDKKSFPEIIKLSSHNIGGVTLTDASIITMVAGLVIMVALTLFINKTKIGAAMLAVSEDKDAARLMGIDVNRTISITFAIGSALAAIAGICYGMTYVYFGPYVGQMPGIKAFIAAVFGGIGSIPGAMLGGVLLGVIEKLAQSYISTQLSDAIVFVVLIVIMLFKPTGLLGKKKREKV